MATKDIILRKRLIKEGIIGIVALVVLGAGGFLLSSFDDDAQTENKSKQNESAAMRAEHDTIEQDLGTGLEVNTFYSAYTRNHSDNFVLNRENATQLLSTLREKNHLANLSITIAPIADSTFETGHLKGNIVTKSEVKLTFSAVTDSSIYGFIESLEATFPGIVIIQDVRFSRTADVSAAIMQELSQHKIPSLVTCDLSFVWLGLHPVDEGKNAALAKEGKR